MRQFTDVGSLRDAVIEIVRHKAGVTSVIPDDRDPAKLIAHIGAQTLTIDLTNLMNRIRAYPEQDPDKLIAEFTAALSDLQNQSVSEKNLVVVLRDSQYVDQISKMKSGSLTEPFADGLGIVYMADLPGSMAIVARNQFPKGLPEARRVALSNVRKWLGHVKSDNRLQFGTLYFVEGNTMLSPTLILLDEFWASIKDRYPGDVLIAVPRKDQLFVFDDSAAGLAIARRLIENTFKDNLSLLSHHLYARRSGKIVAVEG